MYASLLRRHSFLCVLNYFQLWNSHESHSISQWTRFVAPLLPRCGYAVRAQHWCLQVKHCAVPVGGSRGQFFFEIQFINNTVCGNMRFLLLYIVVFCFFQLQSWLE